MKKDKKWAKKEVYKMFPSHDEMYIHPDDITVLKTEMLHSIINLLDQLDEPEVLSGANTMNAIKPQHYRRGQEDLFESWYKRYPFNEYRAIMQSHAEKYINRNKQNRVEDLEKAIYVLQRLKEKEESERNDNS